MNQTKRGKQKDPSFFQHFDFDRSTLQSFFSYHLANVTKQMPNHWRTIEYSEHSA